MEKLETRYGPQVFQWGADLPDIVGDLFHVCGLQFISKKLIAHVPDNQETMMLRAGLDFFSFTPTAGEALRDLFARFDHHLPVAYEYANTGFTYQFKTWMLLSVPQLTPRKWSEPLKHMQHRMPLDKRVHHLVKAGLEREKRLKKHVFDFTRLGAQSIDFAARHHSFVTGDREPVPLGMCLPAPSVRDDCSSSFPVVSGFLCPPNLGGG